MHFIVPEIIKHDINQSACTFLNLSKIITAANCIKMQLCCKFIKNPTATSNQKRHFLFSLKNYLFIQFICIHTQFYIKRKNTDIHLYTLINLINIRSIIAGEKVHFKLVD